MYSHSYAQGNELYDIYKSSPSHFRDATGLKQQGCFTFYSAAAAGAFRGDAAGKPSTYCKARWPLYSRPTG